MKIYCMTLLFYTVRAGTNIAQIIQKWFKHLSLGYGTAQWIKVSELIEDKWCGRIYNITNNN